MTKKSFLDKLTGTGTKEEEKIIEYPEKLVVTKKPGEENEEKAEIAPKSKEKEEWIEAEGQLTVDVYQTDTDLIIKSTIAGVKPEDIDITMTNDMITIKGRRTKDEEVLPKNYFYQELYWGLFSRSISLPVDVDAEKINASMKNGILTVKLPKAEKVKTLKIKVKTE